ncbi:MAG TPA: FlgD immunoglobulin-like domain containing protein [bacterium]|nr:FlgD immunoglobulin-like domain containing protein [bacterium]
MRQAALVAVLLASGFSIALGISKSYDVVPFGNCVAEIAAVPNGGITQYYRNTLDSLTHISWWCGDTFSGGLFNVVVADSVNPSYPIAHAYNVPARQMWAWMDFPLTKDAQPVRGRTYKVTITNQYHNGGPISFAYDSLNPYKYGSLTVNGTKHDSWDLALRVDGLHDTVSLYPWGATCFLPDSRSDWGKWADSMKLSGATWGTFYVRWDTIESIAGTFHFDNVDSEVKYIDSARIEPVAVLVGTPKWASSRIDTIVRTDTPNPDTIVDTTVYAPPLYMDSGPSSNFWVRYLNALLHHVDSLPDSVRIHIHTWSIWNEPNEGCDSWHDPSKSWPGWTGWWRSPDTGYQSDTTWQYRCALYVQLCSLAAKTIRSHTGHDTDRIVIGELGRVVDSSPGLKLVRGVDWLRTFYDKASSSHRFWNVVSVHPYQRTLFFDPAEYADDAESLRAVIRAHDDTAQLWNSEFGFGVSDRKNPSYVDSLQEARNLGQACASTPAEACLPGGTFNRICWWKSCAKCGWGDWGLFASNMEPNAGYFAFKQVTHTLDGKRLNGRVMMGGAKDDSVRIYEFENPTSLKKTWVCWKNTGEGEGSVNVSLPATTDTLTGDILHYSNQQYMALAPAGTNGWLSSTLDERPVFVSEEGFTIKRPDLVVDSLRMTPSTLAIGYQETAHVYFHNAGNDTTPQGPVVGEYALVVLRHNGDSVAYVLDPRPLAPGNSDSISIIVGSVPWSWRGTALFDATVNYRQGYVELHGMDDNDGYSRNAVVWRPPAELIGIMCGCHHNEPLPLFRFETHSLEADSDGSVPAESARLVQWAYHAADTVPYAGDTTAWFCVNDAVAHDTSWLYLSGQSRYKFFVQAKDSWSTSALVPDSAHQFVYFDTTGPTGSVEINGGARFTPISTCTLRLTAHDSASGVSGMRFMNVPKVNLVKDGSFTVTANSWSFYNSEVDTSLRMAVLTAAPPPATVTQFVPAESITAHSGDSCVLEASILARVHDGGATGALSFWYWCTRVDSLNLHDTLWQLADSAGFSGNLLSLTGRCDLSKRFRLMPPVSDSVWVWKGGMVKVEASAENGNGSVWVDNVAMNTFAPESGYVWWAPFETLAQWNIGTGAGRHIVRALYLDSAGNENATPYADTIILDPTPPVVHISLPSPGQLVCGTVELTGWAYDPVEVSGDTWFKVRHLLFREVDSTNWLPVSPDSVSHTPAYPDSQQVLGPAVHLGYWNTASIPDGTYYVRLTGADSAGHVSACTTWVIVSNSGAGGGGVGGPGGGGSGMGRGSVYVGSASGYVLHLSDDLDSLDCFQVTDSGSLAYVTSILEVGNDSILVLDARNKRVHKLHKSGQGRRRLVSGLSEPMGLTRDDDGNFWLVDKGLHKIGKFRSNGTLVFVRGGLGSDSLHFHSPEGIAVKGGLVYVADTKNDRIVAYDTAGTYKAIITGDFTRPTAVLPSDQGAIYLTDGSDGKLKGITPLGGNIVSIKTSDSSKLRGLVLSENKHSLFSIAPQPNKVYKLRILSDDSAPGGQQSAGKINLPKVLSLAQPFPNPARNRLRVAYALPRATRVSVKLYDISGKLVNTLASGEKKPGYYSIVWNRQDAKGRTCACGVYFCTMTAEDKRFSKKIVLTE